MKKLIALILISTQAFAGLPPTTTKGQSDASAKVKFQFQAPHNQFTNLGGIKTLIETGNGNILPDPGFEASVSGWTASGGATATANSTAKGTGAKGYDWDSNSAAQTLQSTSVTIPAGLAGKNGIAYCNIKTVSGTATHTFTVNDGTNDIVTPITIQSSTTAFLGSNEGNKINFVFPSSGTIRIKLAAVNANEPEIYVDDCSISLANNVYDAPLVTAWTSFTPTGSWVTNTTYSGKYRRVGEMMEVQSYISLSGAPTSANLTVNLPSGYTIDTTRLLSASSEIPAVGKAQMFDVGTNNYQGRVHYNSTTNVLVRVASSNSTYVSNSSVTQAIPFTFGNTDIVELSYSVPISGWSAVSAVSADQTDYDWTSYTPTFTGFGTATSVECQHSRVSSDLLLRCKWTSGTPTATEARLSLPNSLVSADTTKIPTIQKAGEIGISVNSATIYYALIEPSVSYLTFSIQGASNNALTKLNGNSFTANGVVNSMQARIPIQGWSSNQRAPTLVGSVTSNASNAEKIERAVILNNGSSCVIDSQSGSWLSAPTRGGTGICSATITGFSAKPTCTVIGADASDAGNIVVTIFSVTTSSIDIRVKNTAGSFYDTRVHLLCMGPR